MLEEFLSPISNRYAILSHTWGLEEVLFKDIQRGIGASKKGFEKLRGCCQKAAGDGFEWVWIDTCCIDKSSSAELSEAINSMYRWYAMSTVCYAYLEDVPADSDPRTLAGEFARSRWFRRGWTLQELIAPRDVRFYTRDWVELGTKYSLAAALAEITKIPLRILWGGDPSTCSVAQRMSWACNRETARDEDKAYCLLGLFNINMPMLYGEGAKSFLRLQKKILKQEEDYSIFAWFCRHDLPDSPTGLLSSSPTQFPDREIPRIWSLSKVDLSVGGQSILRKIEYSQLQRHNLHPHSSSGSEIPRRPPEFTSRGLRVSFPVRNSVHPGIPALAWIYCEIDDQLICVPLSQHKASGTLGRHNASVLVTVDKSMLSEFALTELLLHPLGGDTAKLRRSLIPGAGRTVRPSLEVEVPDSDTYAYTTRLVSANPADRQDGNQPCFFTNFHKLNGLLDGPRHVGSVILFEYFHKEAHVSNAPGRFGVFMGEQDGHLWCEINAQLEAIPRSRVEDESRQSGILDALSGARESELSLFFEKTRDTGTNRTPSDRSVVVQKAWSQSSTDAILFAHFYITKTALGRGYRSKYALQVGVCALQEAEPWMSLLIGRHMG